MFGFVFMLVLLPWLTVIAVYAWVPLALFEGLFYGLAGLVTAGVTRPGRRLALWPVWVACAWVLLEGLRALVPFGGFPWGRLAFAVEDTPVAPAFAYVGAPGATFLVALLGATLAWAVPAVRRTPVRAVAGVVAAAALACVAALLPWSATSPGDPRVTVAAVQGNVPGKGLEAFAERRAVLDNHVPATQALARRVADGDARRSRTWWCGRRTPPTSTPTPTRRPGWPIGDAAIDGRRTPAHGRGRGGPGGRRLAQPGHRVVARSGTPGRVLRQDAPGAVRRVHPAALAAGAPDHCAAADPQRHDQGHPARRAGGGPGHAPGC